MQFNRLRHQNIIYTLIKMMQGGTRAYVEDYIHSLQMLVVAGRWSYTADELLLFGGSFCMGGTDVIGT
jgi:hypothetical protein